MNTLPNVLIVDDTDINLNYLEEILRNVKVNIIKARSGADALEKIKGRKILLAILDVFMPDMNGYELAEKINENKNKDEEEVPVIFLTALPPTPERIIKGYKCGAVDYLFKPVESNLLLSKIKVFLKLFSQKEELIENHRQILASETRLNKTQEISHIGSWELDIASGILTWSDEVYHIYGLPAQEFVVTYEAFIEFVHPEDRTAVDNAYTYSIKDDKDSNEIEHRIFRRHSSEIRYLHEKCEYLRDTTGKIIRLIGMVQDITDRKLAEIALRNSQELFKSVVHNNTDLNILTDKDGVVTYISPQCESVLGYPEEKFIGKIFPDIIHQDDVIACRQTWERVMYQRKELREFEYRIIDNQGDVQWISHSANLLTINDRILGIQSTIRNITENKRIVDALIQSEEIHRTLLKASPDGIIVLNMRGIITDISDITLELFATGDKKDLIGKHFLNLIPPDSANKMKDIIDKTISDGLVQNIEILLATKKLSKIECEISTTLIQDKKGLPVSFMITIRDITNRKKLEKQQLHTESMAMLGEMSTGIAHEINQPLNTISLIMDNVSYEVSKNKDINKDYILKKTDKIFENIIRIKNIIDHIRSFSRSHDDYILTNFNINSSIANAVSMMTEEFKELEIGLDLYLEENMPQIVGNTYKFEQVIINLLRNAKDALLEKKETQKDFLNMQVEIRSYQENQSLIVEVRDNGIGISEKDIDQIMLPFYTTKDSGKGTGLGLSISYQIINDMKGTIDISSDEMKGTLIKIIFWKLNISLQ
ncbi:MAG: PAS domain S-box protein [Ignavibacteriae bacterium]|nr:PAS domain S-box protein [Ignavibacteriota bacterium]